MIKINYPKDIEAFNNSYKACFKKESIKDKSKRFKTLLQSDNKFKDLMQYKFEDILVYPIETLYEISLKYQSIDLTKREINIIKGIFNYDGDKPKNIGEMEFDGKMQEPISKFFMDFSRELGISTCYYCNIDFINSYSSFREYVTMLDFFNNASKNELKELKGIGDSKVDKIENFRNNKMKFTNEEELKSKIGEKTYNKALNSYIKRNKYNLFTLDHVIDKGENPILALSLYNFVPSCYACNTKLKGTKQFISDISSVKMSPSSEKNIFNSDVEFQLLYSKFGDGEYFSNTYDTNISNFGKIILDIRSSDSIYEKYLNIFNLRGRYSFHKKEALNLLKLKEKYSNSQIDKIAELLYKKPKEDSSHFLVDSIKKDIFGREIFEGEIQERSFTKLKRDIAKQIGIKGVKED